MAWRLEDGDAVHGADGLRLDVVAEAAAGAGGEGAAVVRVHPDHRPRRTRHEEHSEERRASEEEDLHLASSNPRANYELIKVYELMNVRCGF